MRDFLLYCSNIRWLNFSYYCLWALCFLINHTSSYNFLFFASLKAKISRRGHLKNFCTLSIKESKNESCHRNCYQQTQSVTIISSLNIRDIWMDEKVCFLFLWMNIIKINLLINKTKKLKLATIRTKLVTILLKKNIHEIKEWKKSKE